MSKANGIAQLAATCIALLVDPVELITTGGVVELLAKFLGKGPGLLLEVLKVKACLQLVLDEGLALGPLAFEVGQLTLDAWIVDFAVIVLLLLTGGELSCGKVGLKLLDPGLGIFELEGELSVAFVAVGVGLA